MLKPIDGNADLKLRFSISQGLSLRHVENVDWTWAELVERLSRSHEDKLSLAQFKELPKDRQAKRKNNGYFVGAQFKRQIREKVTMAERQILTFDIDQGTSEILKGLREGTSGLGAIEYVVYSTRTHGNGAIKLRVVIPLRKQLPHEWFQSISRILAWQLDFKMLAVDTVSFVPTQIMYWPAHCCDIKPIFIHHRGPLLDVSRTLEEWGPWQDIGMLPRSPREPDLLRESGSSKQNPLDKRGVVGAFCRTYDIHDAIETFLPEIYAPSEVGADGVPTRYSYVPGSLTNGVQVYADGHMQSFHGSDPAGGQNLNSFDLVRLHLHGEKDGAREPEDDPRKMRSYKAMEQMLVDDESVARELRESNYGDDDDVWDDDPADAIEVETSEATSDAEIPDSTFEIPEDTVDGNWQEGLATTEKGIIKSNLPNILLILRNAKRFRGRFAHNEFTHFDGIVKPIRVKSLRIDLRVPAGKGFVSIEAQHFATIRVILESPHGKGKPGWGLRVTQTDLREAVLTVCRENSFHPVRDWLGGLTWDGKSRLDSLWVKACHTPNTPYHRSASRLFLTAAVARIMEPGTKFDYMPVISGPQGIRKSTLVAMLGSLSWSGETEGHFDDKKKFVEASLGFWFLENSEMTHFRRASDDDAIKAMLSGTEDTVRLSYRPDPQTFPRQFVMIGTTNATTYLRDRHRRIWSIVCGAGDVDVEWVVSNRDQLFAEAVVEYRRMRRETNTPWLPLYLTGEAKAEHETRQDDHLLPNEAEMKAGIVRDWLDIPVPLGQSKPGWDLADEADDAFAEEELVLRAHTCAVELYERALGNDISKYDMRAARSIGDLMRFLEPDWRVAPLARCGKYGRQRSYVRTAKPDESGL